MEIIILDFSTSKSSFSVNTFIIPNCLFIYFYILECTNRAKMDNYLPGEEKISSKQGSISKFCSNEDVFEVKYFAEDGTLKNFKVVCNR